MVNLGFGACKMSVAGPETLRGKISKINNLRVATKFPEIAKDYFQFKKGQTIDIIKLNGSIELAPLVGLSEVIVDIVETGSTLRENGLGVLEEIRPLSARMVVNPVSMEMERERIAKLISEIKAIL
jgi:ATP phosphoribosyltransferase